MKKYFLFSFFTLFLLSCGDNELLEIDEIANGNKIVGFQNAIENVAYFEDLGQIESNFAIKFIGLGNGSLPDSNLDIEYEIDLVNSTATEGIEFQFFDNTRKVTISKGESFTNLPILVNTGNLNPGMPTVLYINLKPVNGVTIAEFNKTLKIVFVGCETNLEGTYTYGSKIANVTKIAPNVYRSTYMPAFASVYWFEFSDVCGELQILDWQFQGSNPISDTDDTNSKPSGYVDSFGNLVFEHANVAGVSWYVDLTWTLTKI